jgi:hypothetical protein
MFPVANGVRSQQIQAAGGLDDDTFVQHTIQQIDELHSRWLAYQTHIAAPLNEFQ